LRPRPPPVISPTPGPRATCGPWHSAAPSRFSWGPRCCSTPLAGASSNRSAEIVRGDDPVEGGIGLHHVRNAVIPMMQASSARHGPQPDGSPTAPNFSPSRALEAIGERWSLLIMRDALFRGTSRFDDFLRHAGAEPDILAERLDGFVGAGLMEL